MTVTDLKDYIWYYPNGLLKKEVTWDNNLMHGPVKYYDEQQKGDE